MSLLDATDLPRRSKRVLTPPARQDPPHNRGRSRLTLLVPSRKGSRARDLDAQGETEQGVPVAPPRGVYATGGKRFASLLVLVPCLPLAMVVSLPITLINWAIFGDPRRILFLQPRVGKNGDVFHIYKFRTMTEVPGSHFESWSSGQDQLRVTRFGRLLRKTHLDELPQLINVLRGQMDIVGPRPEMLDIEAWACRRIPDFHHRKAVRPGITGCAQITQGYTPKQEEAYQEKLALDLEYIGKMSPLRDAAIIARTISWMLRGRGWRLPAHKNTEGPTSGPAQSRVPTKQEPPLRERNLPRPTEKPQAEAIG